MNYHVSGELEDKIDFGEMDNRFFLIGLLNEFMNRFQTVGDHFFQEVSWKQCFALICLQYFKEPPTLKELSILMGSSHQNVKQILLKLEKTGFVRLASDEYDRRKQRVVLTEKAGEFFQYHDGPSENYVDRLFEPVSDEALMTTIQTVMQLDSQLQNMQDIQNMQNVQDIQGIQRKDMASMTTPGFQMKAGFQTSDEKRGEEK